VDWTDGLSGIEWIFQRDDFGPDVTTAALGLLESVVGDKSAHHVGMRRNQDTEGFARDLRSGVYEGDRFHSARKVPSSASTPVKVHVHLVLGFETFECRLKNPRETARSAPANFPILQAVQGYWQAFSLKGGYGLGLRQVVCDPPLGRSERHPGQEQPYSSRFAH
jgi:hypothetical protein